MTTNPKLEKALCNLADRGLLTKPEAELISNTKKAVAVLLEARKAADQIRPIVKDYADRFAVQLGHESYDELFWSDDEETFARCDALCKAERRRLNLPVRHKDNCPLLEAEEKVREAERVVLDSLKPLTGLDWADWTRNMDLRKRAVECCVRLYHI